VTSWEHAGITFNPLHRPWAPQCTASHTDGRTDRRTDRRQYDANSRSYRVS